MSCPCMQLQPKPVYRAPTARVYCRVPRQLDVVDPGTVLMWIFGSILALLWLLFVFYCK